MAINADPREAEQAENKEQENKRKAAMTLSPVQLNHCPKIPGEGEVHDSRDKKKCTKRTRPRTRTRLAKRRRHHRAGSRHLRQEDVRRDEPGLSLGTREVH